MERSQFTFYESFAKALSRIRKKADRADAYDAICNYALYGIEPDIDSLSDSAAIAFSLIRPNLDASKRKAESGKRGGLSKQTASKDEANSKQTASEKEKEKEKEKEYECITPISPLQASDKQKPEKHKHGRYGWVLLTNEEYDRLVLEHGVETVSDAIDYVDEAAQSTGNKNKWKDWNLTVRRCIRDGWGQRNRSSTQPAAGNPFDALRREVQGL